jgi:hypothetical protein
MLCVFRVWRGTGQARFHPLSAILTARQAARRMCLVCHDPNKSDALLVLASLCRSNPRQGKARLAATVCRYQKQRRLVLTRAYVCTRLCLRVRRLQLPVAKTVVLRCPVLRDERDGACATKALDGRVLPAMTAGRPAGERASGDLCGGGRQSYTIKS